MKHNHCNSGGSVSYSFIIEVGDVTGYFLNALCDTRLQKLRFYVV
jgi:hypothetical protein